MYLTGDEREDGEGVVEGCNQAGCDVLDWSQGNED